MKDTEEVSNILTKIPQGKILPDLNLQPFDLQKAVYLWPHSTSSD